MRGSVFGAHAPLSLQDFIRRSSVRALYRKFLRTAKKADPSLAGELRQQIQFGFREHVLVSDEISVKFLISDAKKTLKKLEEMVEMSQ
mmetsp:Transcript_3355/g.5926  ORF Transcript_3355/g.5926 Transcript_3355/m.5926 type:complete len:88 (+) Transcript_3355:4-267(+)